MKRKVRVTVCDSCGSENEGKPFAVLAVLTNRRRKVWELCDVCAADLDNWLEGRY